jgi:hypothetical protein
MRARHHETEAESLTRVPGWSIPGSWVATGGGVCDAYQGANALGGLRRRAGTQ